MNKQPQDVLSVQIRAAIPGLDLGPLASVPLDDCGQLPNTPCIYFAMSGESVQYIGRSVNPRHRWIKHHRHEQVSEMDAARIAYLSCPRDLLDSVEQALIEWFTPPLNAHRSALTELAANARKKREDILSRTKSADITVADDIIQRNNSPEDIAWLNARIEEKINRIAYIEVLKARGCADDWQGCIDVLYEELLGIERDEGIESRLSNKEIAIISFAECLAVMRLDADKAQGYDDCRKAALNAAHIVKDAIAQAKVASAATTVDVGEVA